MKRRFCMENARSATPTTIAPVPVRSAPFPYTGIPAITWTRTHPCAWHPHVAMRTRFPAPISLHPDPAAASRRHTFEARRRWRDLDAHAYLRRRRWRVAHAGQCKANPCHQGQFASDADHVSLSLKCGSCTWALSSWGNASVSDRVDVMAFAGSGNSRSICDGRPGRFCPWK